jgi:hypothetical protein
MTSYRPRSPTRRYIDPRAQSTTSIASSFDSRPPRYDKHYETQEVARQNYIDNGYDRGTTSRTQYVVRPRHNSFVAEESRRPLSILVDSRNRPIVNNSAWEMPISPSPKSNRPRDEPDRFLHPSAIVARQTYSDQRQHSANRADTDRLIVATRGGRERRGYHQLEPIGQKSYPASRPAIRLDDGYSYTGPREQFERDYPVRPVQPRESQASRDRPASVVDFPELKPPSTLRRDLPPPSAAARQFDKIERSEPTRSNIRSSGDSDFERSDEMSRRRLSLRNPVVHQTRDDNYPKDDYEGKRGSRHAKPRYDDEDNLRSREHGGRDREYDRDGRNDRDGRKIESRRQPRSRENSPDRPVGSKSAVPGSDNRRIPRSRDNSPERAQGKGLAPPAHDSRRKPRSRESSPERSGIGKGLAAAGLGSLAAAGLANGLKRDPEEKDDNSDSEARRERRHRRRREKQRERELREADDTNADARVPRDRPSPSLGDVEPVHDRREYFGKEASDSNSQDDHRKGHGHNRRRSRHEKGSQAEEGLAELEPDRAPDRAPPPVSQELQRVEMRDPEEDSDRRRRKRLEYQGRDRDRDVPVQGL